MARKRLPPITAQGQREVKIVNNDMGLTTIIGPDGKKSQRTAPPTFDEQQNADELVRRLQEWRQSHGHRA